ncbi:MAG: TolC family protein [Lewinellaceae bacterium]|nr:TolC family protein [Lewinellaceae bacterium]
MQTRTIITTLALAWCGLVSAQTVHTLSLEQAVSLALQNAEELKNLRLDVAIQELNNKEITGTVYPQISASGQGSYYTNLPLIQFPSSNFPIYEVLQDLGVKDGNGNPVSTSDATTTSHSISFVAPLNFQYGITVNQLIFQPDIFIALQAKETILQYNRDNLSVSENNVKEAVQKAYYSVLIAEEQKRILDETAVRLDQLIAEMNQMYKSGFVEKLDIDKLTVSQNNTTAAINQLVNSINISKSLLKNAVTMPINDELNLTEKLETQDLKALLLANTDDFNYENRSEIVLLNTARQLQEIDVKRQKAAKLPTVSAFYQLQRFTSEIPILPLREAAPGFGIPPACWGLACNSRSSTGCRQNIEPVRLN